MRLEIIEITPEMAQKWLAGSSSRQRPLAQRRVERLASAIRRGQWHTTHQAIALDAQMNIVDGRHRLAAIATSGLAVKALVAFDADPGSVSVIDTGMARTPGQTLMIEGISGSHVVAAASRVLLAYDAIDTADAYGAARQMVTTQDIIEMLEGPRGELVEQMRTRAYRVATALGHYGTRTAVLAFMVLLAEDSGLPDAKEEFLTRLEDGQLLVQGSPILAVRHWLVSATGFGSVPSTSKTLAGVVALIRSFNDYAAGRERKMTQAVRPGETLPRIKTAI